MRSPYMCPNCEYISPRNWNVKSHINKKHGGLGEPVRIYRRRELALSEQENIPYHKNSLKDLINEYPTLSEFQLFNRNDAREMELAKKFKALVPQFLELERLLKSSQDLPEQHIQFVLADNIISAITTSNPVIRMSELFNYYKNMSTINRMLNCICISRKMNVSQVKNSLINFQ
jgi:hypothetical protein